VTRTVDGLTYQLCLTDTAGQEEYRGLWTSSNLKSDAFLLVYDITNADSLDALNHFIGLIDMEAESRADDEDARLPPPVKIVAGNKCDLAGNRQVKSQTGLEWARKHGCGFMETSARNVVNIEETFACMCLFFSLLPCHPPPHPFSPQNNNHPFPHAPNHQPTNNIPPSTRPPRRRATPPPRLPGSRSRPPPPPQRRGVDQCDAAAQPAGEAGRRRKRRGRRRTRQCGSGGSALGEEGQERGILG
jgi:small GTP-binding protein